MHNNKVAPSLVTVTVDFFFSFEMFSETKPVEPLIGIIIFSIKIMVYQKCKKIQKFLFVANHWVLVEIKIKFFWIVIAVLEIF